VASFPHVSSPNSLSSTSCYILRISHSSCFDYSLFLVSTTNHTPFLLTPRCRVLLEQLTGLQLVKKFPSFHGTRRFITALTSDRHLSLSWASPNPVHIPTSWRSVVISIHLHLGLPSGLFPSGFPTKTLYTPLSSQFLLM
jgi:hypothetical protein